MEVKATPIVGLYSGLVDEVITQLKTIAELADDADGARVYKWEGRHLPVPGRSEVEVKAGPAENQGGLTQHSVTMEFNVICDLIYWANAEGQEGAFDTALGVAEKIYDQFNLTNINSLIFKCLVSLAPGDGELSSKNMLAIPIRIILRCEKDVRR